MPGNMNSVRKLCWYDLIGKGLQASGLQEETIETPDGPIRRYSAPRLQRPQPGATALPQHTNGASYPTGCAQRSPRQRRRSFPAVVGCGRQRAGRSGRANRSRQRTRAIQRGTLVHRLLQSLPDLAAERRRDIALKFLARNATAWSDAERRALAERC